MCFYLACMHGSKSCHYFFFCHAGRTLCIIYLAPLQKLQYIHCIIYILIRTGCDFGDVKMMMTKKLMMLHVIMMVWMLLLMMKTVTVVIFIIIIMMMLIQLLMIKNDDDNEVTMKTNAIIVK